METHEYMYVYIYIYRPFYLLICLHMYTYAICFMYIGSCRMSIINSMSVLTSRSSSLGAFATDLKARQLPNSPELFPRCRAD